MNVCLISGSSKNNSLPHVTESAEPLRWQRDATILPKVSSMTSEVHDWWHEQLTYSNHSSEDEL